MSANETPAPRRIAEAATAGDGPRQAWLAAVAAATAEPGDYAPVSDTGIGGHELAVLDFDPVAAEWLRRLGQTIATPPAPGVRTALAVTGSCAQGRVHPFPTDVDFFERVHLSAPTRAEALRRLGQMVRETVARVAAAPGFALEEVYFGHLPASLADAQPHRVGAALAWREADVAAGAVELRVPGGGPAGRATWAAAAADPGFVKLDWFVGGGVLARPARVSKVIDPTWQGPDGRMESLDGAVDADFQQVYLAAAAAALAEQLTGGTAGDRAGYLAAMEQEVVRYRRHPADHAKVAKRLYNLCRLSGRFAEALFLRDLLAEPPARLAQLRAALEVTGLRPCAGREGDVVTVDQAAILDELDAALPGDTAWASAAAACREGGGEGVRRTAMAALDALLAERVDAAFRARLLGHRPTAALLADLEARRQDGGWGAW